MFDYFKTSNHQVASKEALKASFNLQELEQSLMYKVSIVAFFSYHRKNPITILNSVFEHRSQEIWKGFSKTKHVCLQQECRRKSVLYLFSTILLQMFTVIIPTGEARLLIAAPSSCSDMLKYLCLLNSIYASANSPSHM